MSQSSNFLSKSCSEFLNGDTPCAINRARGFSLIELLVCVAIITIIAGVIVLSESKLRSSLNLSNTTHEIAFLFKNAQSSASNVAVGIQTVDADAGFGIKITQPSSSQTQFLLFRDLPSTAYPNGDGVYDNLYPHTNDDAEWLPSQFLPSQLKVSRFALQTSNGTTCMSTLSTSQAINVTYHRPILQATIKATNIAGISGNISLMQIQLEDSRQPNVYRYALISASGMISVSSQSQLTCP